MTKSLAESYAQNVHKTMENLLEFFLANGGDVQQLGSQESWSARTAPVPAVISARALASEPRSSDAEDENLVHPKARFKDRVAEISREVLRSRRDVSGMHLRGTTFCITGKLREVRSKIEAMIVEMGGSTTGSVSRHVDCLVCGEKPGSKLVRARALGIPIISEESFFKMIDGRF